MGPPMIDAVFVLAQQAAEAEGGRNWGWLADPRTTVLFVLGSIVLIGGGRRLLMASRARKAVDRLAEPNVTPEEIVAAAEHGRPGLIEFFRLLAEGQTPEIRSAAGRALAIVWANDDLIPEEEKAVLTRGFDVRWRARRRYPRAMTTPIPIEVTYGLPFLEDEGPGIHPNDLEWSHRIAGAERAALELPSGWRAGAGRATFTIDPGDFPTNGPHRLILKATGRTGPGLTSNWEVEPPHVPFQVEFDPKLTPDALFTMPDASKGEAIAAAIRLSAPSSPDDDEPRFLDLPGEFVVRDPPVLQIQVPLPSDLAHRVRIEFEGMAVRAGAGQVVVTSKQEESGQHLGSIELAIGPVIGLPPETFDRPGEVRLRATLEPDPDLGWADPDVRSLWPETITTDWYPVRLIRR
ncbi:hypothetical protein [Tautonia rosea]|uniref:hypothetical protein n=1 Tax=Tautonia rosea TaxID=2728037 RepID=UPI0014760754|nr:hypothetical protein [Tautonia rosea]